MDAPEDFVYMNNFAWVGSTEDGYEVVGVAKLMNEQDAEDLADKIDACIRSWFEEGMPDHMKSSCHIGTYLKDEFVSRGMGPISVMHFLKLGGQEIRALYSGRRKLRLSEARLISYKFDVSVEVLMELQGTLDWLGVAATTANTEE